MYNTLFILAVYFLIASPAISQPVLTPSLTDTLALSEVEEREQITYKKENNKPATAVIIDRYKSGSIKMRRVVVNGKAHGIWLEWYESGISKYIGEWKQGEGDGIWMYFHENGQLRSREEVREDLWHGISESWYNNGKKNMEGFLFEGLKHGAWFYWDKTGKFLKVEHYIHGNLIKTVTEL